ncbi:MAG: hypothetical protein AAFQ82_11940, partial [Myxococcota bacterium]
MKSLLRSLCLWPVVFGCATERPTVNPTSFNTSIPAPRWADEPDRETEQGNRFTCRGDGGTEEDAQAAAHAACNDKICRLCGVEVRSVLKSEETLDGVSLRRQVEERCRRVQTRDFDVLYKTSSCAPEGCSSWIQIDYPNELKDLECRQFSDENYASPDECKRLIDAFAAVEGMTEAAFAERESHLRGALSACAEIDVRPTPLLQTLDETLWQGWNDRVQFVPREGFEQRPDRRAKAMERLRQKRRYDLEKQRRELTRRFYPRLSPRRVQTEVPNFLERIEMVREFMENRVPIFAMVDALCDPSHRTENGSTLYTAKGAKALEQRFAALPATAHRFDPEQPPHRDLFLALEEAID